LQEVLNFIEERLSELETEKEELTEYEQLDKHRRALEYNLYDKELSKASEQLGRIEVVREEQREMQQVLHARLREIQDALQIGEESINMTRQALDRLSTRRAEKAADLSATLQRRSVIEVELQEAEVNISISSLNLGENPTLK
jgi:structural maintenance of chromosome 3 (chondroitin sulfate proteoglycan 6)